MSRAPASLLPVLALVLSPLPALAQDGPSFDCAYARTDTEIAICSSSDLSQLEMRMAESYEVLATLVGEQKARQIADRQLARRQACGANEDCIAQRLATSMRIFERRARRAAGTELAAVEPSDLAADPSLAAPETEPEARPAPQDTPEPLADAIEEAIAEAELTSSDEALAPPVALVFQTLPPEERLAIQDRLVQSGYHDGPASGDWDEATSAALVAYLAAEGEGFDPSTEGGAGLMLDYVRSDAFAEAHGIETGDAALADVTGSEEIRAGGAKFVEVEPTTEATDTYSDVADTPSEATDAEEFAEDDPAAQAPDLDASLAGTEW